MYEAGATNSVIETSAKSLPQERANELPVLLVTLPVSQKQRRLAVTVIIAVGIAFLITLPYATIPLRRIDAFVPAIQGMLFLGRADYRCIAICSVLDSAASGNLSNCKWLSIHRVNGSSISAHFSGCIYAVWFTDL
jgi:hypothetical protein